MAFLTISKTPSAQFFLLPTFIFKPAMMDKACLILYPDSISSIAPIAG